MSLLPVRRLSVWSRLDRLADSLARVGATPAGALMMSLSTIIVAINAQFLRNVKLA